MNISSLTRLIFTSMSMRQAPLPSSSMLSTSIEEEVVEESAVITELSFSKRSQKSVLKEIALENEIRDRERHLDGVVSRIERLKHMQRDCETVILNRPQDSYMSTEKLGELINGLAGDQRVKEICEAKIESLRAQLESLRHPASEQAEKRSTVQAEIARILLDRLKKDELIENTLQGLRLLLEERREMTANMEQLGEEIELRVDFDHARFHELAKALPADVAGESHRWADHFLGTARTEGQEYRVVSQPLVVEEILSHCGVYREDETLNLAPDKSEQHADKVRPAAVQ